MTFGRALVAWLVLVWMPVLHAATPVVVGSKRFTESYILAEIVRQSLDRAGIDARHRPGLGNTAILFDALKAGGIDVYPEYTGTIARELLKIAPESSADPATLLADLNRSLDPLGLVADVPLGFSNGYALAMREDEAARLNVRTLSDLEAHPKLRFGLSHEFLGRADGWPGLARAYGLTASPSGLDHGLAYEALAAGRIDVIDVYTTDAKIGRFGLRVLKDDRRFFPSYAAVLLFRKDFSLRHPDALSRLRSLAGTIDERRMIALNAAAELDGVSFAEAAARYFADGGTAQGSDAAAPRRTLVGLFASPEFDRLLREHLLLTFVSVLLAVAVGVPAGILAYRLPRVGQVVIGLVGVAQTIPALALLAMLIAVLGRIGFVPALVALFVYALLPIVRNTHAGLAEVAPGLLQAATALGLTDAQRLFSVELPLAWPTILAGVQTAAVISVGTATIAAFIGAGGFGEWIAAGLALNDTTLLLAGAIPAAVLAVLVQGLFVALERRIRWRGADRQARPGRA